MGAGRVFAVGITGSEDPNALVGAVATAQRAEVQALVVRLAEEGPLPLAEVEPTLARMDLTVETMVDLGIFAVRAGRVHIAFNYLDAGDQLRCSTSVGNMGGISPTS
jgi:limonene-1,2-epoxide hydrolase